MIIVGMIILVFCVVYGLDLLIFPSIMYSKHDEWVSHIIGTILLIIGISSFIGGIMISVHYSKQPWVTDKTIAVENIVALGNDKDAEGRFFLHSGYVQEEPYYYYMVKCGDGGYVMNKVPALHDTTTIYYTDKDFRVEWYLQKRGKGLDCHTRTIYNIYIPAGSIDETFSISLQ